MSNVTIQEFERRNAEAQRINAEIQKAQGALDENKRQFEELCKQYEAEFGEHIDASNIEAVFNRVYEEVAKSAEEQRVALEGAKNGVVVGTNAETSDVTAVQPQNVAPQPTAPATQPAVTVPQPTAPTTQPAVTAPQPAVQSVAPAAVPPVVAPQPADQMAALSQQAVFGAPTQPVVAPQPVVPAPNPTPVGEQMTFGTMETAAPQPISATAIPQTVISAQVDIKQPVEQDTSEQIQPAYSIPGWGTANNADIDFNEVLGGTFGGGQ